MVGIKDKIASGLGSVSEWYDFALYGFFAPVIAQLYFPSAAPNIGLLKTFSVFAIGFFARPLGALLFGHISDKVHLIRTDLIHLIEKDANDFLPKASLKPTIHLFGGAK